MLFWLFSYLHTANFNFEAELFSKEGQKDHWAWELWIHLFETHLEVIAHKDNNEDSREGNTTKHSRKEEILRPVNSVFAAVASNIPLSILSKDYMRIYLKCLDPMHKPPHHLEVTRIVECAIDVAIAELSLWDWYSGLYGRWSWVICWY